MKFAELSLAHPIRQAVADKGYETATPIQAKTIPLTLEGRDVLGIAQTGTGKTAAFALPILHRLHSALPKDPRKRSKLPAALILAPTRELAEQIFESFREYGSHLRIKCVAIYGGVGFRPQTQALHSGVDVVIATPGRLLDLISQGQCKLSMIKTFVLDEADRMMDMGFMPDIKKIIKCLPAKKQTLLFSATMPREIKKLADSLLHNPAEVSIAPESPTVERIEQAVYHVEKTNKSALLINLILSTSITRAIVFTRTKYGADRVTRHLNKAGIGSSAIHGDKSQAARRKALDRFRDGKIQILVATDIAARGIDVDGVSHVFNYDISRDTDNHVHRIGRTARAGADGVAISFCAPDEVPLLRAIERLIRKKLTVVDDLPDLTMPAPRPKAERPAHHEPERKPSGKSKSKRGSSKRSGDRNRSGKESKEASRSGTSSTDRSSSHQQGPSTRSKNGESSAKQMGGKPGASGRGKFRRSKAKRSGGPNAGAKMSGSARRGSGAAR